MVIINPPLKGLKVKNSKYRLYLPCNNPWHCTLSISQFVYMNKTFIMSSILFLIYQQSHIHPLILISSKLEMLKYYNKDTHKVVGNIIITLLSPWLPHITWWIIVRLSLRHCSSLSSVYTRSHGSLYKALPNYVVYKRTQLTLTLQITLVLQYNRGPSSSFLGKVRC